MNKPVANESDVLVIGGGLHGSSSAFHIARRGVSVTVLEADYVGRHASGVNAGGVRTLGRPLPEIPLALMSREIWHNMVDTIGDDAGFVASGQLKIAETEAELDECRERVALLEAHGFTHEKIIDRETVLELEPAIAPHVTGGIWVERDGYALPFRTTTAFRLAAERHGAVFHEGTPVTRIEQKGERWFAHTPSGVFSAAKLVVTAGAWSGELSQQVGEPVPVHPEGLMLMVTHRAAPFCRATLGATGRPLSFKQFDNGTVVIGGKLIGIADLPGRHGEVDFSAAGEEREYGSRFVSALAQSRDQSSMGRCGSIHRRLAAGDLDKPACVEFDLFVRILRQRISAWAGMWEAGVRVGAGRRSVVAAGCVCHRPVQGCFGGIEMTHVCAMLFDGYFK